MIRWIDQPFLAPFLACVAPPDGEAFGATVIERMVQATRQSDGRFHRVRDFAGKEWDAGKRVPTVFRRKS
jgi:hypothetical protein